MNPLSLLNSVENYENHKKCFGSEPQVLQGEATGLRPSMGVAASTSAERFCGNEACDICDLGAYRIAKRSLQDPMECFREHG